MLYALFFAAHAATACPDLTGRYTLPGEDGHVAISIAQNKCESLTLGWLIYSYPDTSPGTYVVQVDGRPHRQKAWFGRADSTWITAMWRDDQLEIVAQQIPGHSGSVRWSMAFGLTSKHNLCVGSRAPVKGGRLATRIGGQVEATDDAFTCLVKETGGLTSVAAGGGAMVRAQAFACAHVQRAALFDPSQLNAIR